MPADILSLPLEVHREIFSLLLYPELTKLRMTCRQLQHVSADDVVRKALQSLEDDWAEATLRTAEHYKNGINISSSELLRAWGYDNEKERVRFEFDLLPCYGCVRLRGADDFVLAQTLRDVTINTVAFANSNQQLPNAVGTRKCLECYCETDDYLTTPGGRWVSTKTRGGQRYWFAICRSCDDFIESDEEPAARQRVADLCEGCFRQDHPKWFQHRYEIGQRRHIIQQQIGDLQARDEGLSKYCQWMDKVDDGASVLQDRPPYLDGMEMPNVGVMRPDAILKLPDKEERKRAILRR